jgi:hypothetical protein
MAHSCVARCQTLSMADLHDPCISTLRSRESFTISTCLDQERVICGRGPGRESPFVSLSRDGCSVCRNLNFDSSMVLLSI